MSYPSCWDEAVQWDRDEGDRRASAPGLATPIFEWVKTKNRNDGCPADTPGQHYEQRPLIDVGVLEFGDSDR